MVNFSAPEFAKLAHDLKTQGWAFGPALWSGDLEQVRAWLKNQHEVEANGIDAGRGMWIDLDIWHGIYKDWERFATAYEVSPSATPESVGLRRKG